MINEMYMYFGLMAIIISLLLIKCNNTLQAKDATSRKYFNLLLAALSVFYFADAFWGYVGSSRFLFHSDKIFGFASLMFHLFASITPFFWMMFMYLLLDIKEKKIVSIILLIPLVVCLNIICMQPSTNCIFTVKDMIYTTSKYRIVLFIIQNFYFDFTFIRVLPHIIFHRKEYSLRHTVLIISATIIPIMMGILQFINPDMAFYSMGYLLNSLIVFNGLLVIKIDRESFLKSEKYKNESTYNFKLLESLAQNFVSIHAFNLLTNTQKMIKSTPEIESFVKPEDNAHDQIAKVMAGVTDKEYTNLVVDFVDTYSLSERLQNKNSVSQIFLGKNQGWCMSTFIKVDEDENGNLTQCLHVVQSIHESKQKEAEYEEALKRAYRSENAIYSEFLKMQTSGFLATNEKEEIIIANDTALEMFGQSETDCKQMGVREFLKNATIENMDEVLRDFKPQIEANGKYTFYITTQSPDGSRENHIMADVKSIEMPGSERIDLTCFTDITKGKEIEEQLRVLSEIDALTQISNRRSGEAKTCALIKDRVSGIFCLLDINHFKSINDTYGHQLGDKALIYVADAIKKSFRSNDVIMRLGGDEFAIFAPNVTTKELAENCIKRLFDEINSIVISGMPEHSIKVSLGACFILCDDESDSASSFDELYQKADAAMYSCKRLEGNNYSIN